MRRYVAAGSRAAAVLTLAIAPGAFAQTAPAAEPTAASDEEVVVLSPFVVSAEEDKGSYTAKDTLAGSRVRTELKDVGSAISVVTDQFMKDVGIKSNEELLKYTVGTEVGGVSGNFSGVGDGRQVNESDKLLRPNGNTRVRGLKAADNTRDFFLSDIPWDGYNVGRVDIQRGPNAILFGMGSPAGIINHSTNQASFNNENKLEFRFDNEGSTRAVLDANAVLLPDELAVRVAGLSDHTNYRQKPAFNNDERVYSALRYDPAFLQRNGMSTSLRLNYEHGRIRSNRPRSLTPSDQITPWFTELDQALYDAVAENNPDGSGVTTQRLAENYTGPLGNPYDANPRYNPWIGAFGNVYGNVTPIFNYGATSQSDLRNLEGSNFTYWAIDSTGARDANIAGLPYGRELGVKLYADYMQAISAPYASVGAYKDKHLDDDAVGLFDFYNHLLDGDTKREWRNFETFNAALTQTFFDGRIGFEAAWDKQRYNDGQYNGVTQNLYVDVNTTHLDGTANPNAGAAFVQLDNGGSKYETDSEAQRYTGFAEFRSSDFFGKGLLSRLLGRHVFTGMFASEEKDTTALQFRQYIADDAYDVAMNGTDTAKWNITSNERTVTSIAYLSGNLAGATYGAVGLRGIQGTPTPSATGGILTFDSHWRWPLDPTAADYVDPAAVWTPPAGYGGDTQADNPGNYNGWSRVPVGIWSYRDGDADKLYSYGLKTTRKVETKAFVWQGYLLDGVFVPSVGWRRDVYRGGNLAGDDGLYNSLDASLRPTNQEKQLDIHSAQWTFDAHPEKIQKVTGESLSYSFVVHTPEFIKNKMPARTNLSLFYNRSANFQPSPGDVDMFGQALANPEGKTKDYGFIVSTLDDRLSLKVNWYRTSVTNDRLSGFEFWRISQYTQVLLMNAARINYKDLANDWKWSAENTNGTATQAQFDAGAAAVLAAYDNNQVFHDYIDSWGFTPYLADENVPWVNPPAGISASTDTVSKGVEFELNIRPTDNWNIAINASKTTATQLNIGGALKEWVEAVQGLAEGPAGDLRQWWAGDTNTMRDMWNANILSQFNLLKLKEGSNVAELRPWRFNLVTNYGFGTGRLKGVNVGAAYRWEDAVEIGYPVIQRANETTGSLEYVYDVAHPHKGPTESHLDLWIGYGKKLTEKIDWRIQLNLRDVLAEKKLIPISSNPDGSPAAYRIPEQTSWSITNTFTF